MNYLNSVTTSVKIDDHKVHIVSLHLVQRFNDHHCAEITVDYEELDSAWMNSPLDLIKLIGKPVHIEMSHRQTGESNYFYGIVTSFSAVAAGVTDQGRYCIMASSPTILLDDAPHQDSFTEESLGEIVKDIAERCGNGTEIKSDPHFSSQIPYFCQYKESGFEVLNRLSWLYNESFYYDGLSVLFGAPRTPEEIKLTYQLELFDFHLSVNMVPDKFHRYSYVDTINRDKQSSSSQGVPAAKGYLQVALNQMKEIWSSDPYSSLDRIVGQTPEVDDLTKELKNQAASRMVIFEGKSNTCRVKLGALAKIWLHKNMKAEMKHIGEFTIVEVSHHITAKGDYTNHFKAVPGGFTGVNLLREVPAVALPEVATVVSNDTNNGRVKVQFKWQVLSGKTSNWIRVQTPDAGISDKVSENRGLVFIPEVGDQVMINYVNGDPSQPFVSGSMFPEGEGKGGGRENHLKSIRTRSGHVLQFDDADDTLGIIIRDRNGNCIRLDSQGKNIDITAPETLTLTAKNIILNAEEKASVNASDILHNANAGILQFSKTMTTNPSDEYNLHAKEIKEVGDVVSIYSQKDTMTLYSKKNVETNSGSQKIKLS